MLRRPLGARRDGAERYLILTIATFAVTVAGVRWYLDLAGYPTIGGGGLHVAHVLWGGLALFIAVLFPLLWSGHRALLLSALLAGVGAGLFIDEVGKFLTTSNDYFFAPAAPIIYGTVLLLVLLWLIVRRRSGSTFDATHAAVEALGAGVDGRLTYRERARVVDQMSHAHSTAQEAASGSDALADAVMAALLSPAMDERLASEGWIAKGGVRRTLERFLPTRLERWLIAFGLLWAALAAAVGAIVIVAVATDSFEWFQILSEEAGRMEIPSEPIWLLLMATINVVVGISCTVALVLLIFRRRRIAMNIALGATMVGLIAGGLVGFYAVQLAALTSTLQLLLLAGLIADQRIRLEREATATAAVATGVDDGAD